MTVIPANPTPKRATKKVSSLGPHRGRQQWVASQKHKSKFVVAAVALAAIASNNQADVKQ